MVSQFARGTAMRMKRGVYMKKWKQIAAMMAVTAALGGTAMAYPDYQYRHQDMYYSNRVVKNVDVQQYGRHSQVRGTKIVDRTERGVGQQVLADLFNTAGENRDLPELDLQTKLQQVLDRAAAGKYALVVLPRMDAHRDFHRFLIFDADRVDEQQRAYDKERKGCCGRHDRIGRPGYDHRDDDDDERDGRDDGRDDGDWDDRDDDRDEEGLWRRHGDDIWQSIQRAIDRADDILGGIRWDPWGDRGDRWPRQRQDMSIHRIDVNRYVVRDDTRTLSREDVNRIQDLVAPYKGQHLRVRDVERALEEVDDYLDLAFGGDLYEVYYDDLQPASKELTIRVVAASDFREATSESPFAEMLIGFVDETNSLSRAELSAIENILEERAESTLRTQRKLAKAKEDVEGYLQKRYGKKAFRVQTQHRLGNVYQVIVKR